MDRGGTPTRGATRRRAQVRARRDAKDEKRGRARRAMACGEASRLGRFPRQDRRSSSFEFASIPVLAFADGRPLLCFRAASARKPDRGRSRTDDQPRTMAQRQGGLQLESLSPQQLQARSRPRPRRSPPVLNRSKTGSSQPSREDLTDASTRPSLSSEQGLSEQLEQDVNQLTESLANLQKAVARYHTSGRALESMADETEGKEMLVPLTSSLYVPGKLGAVDTVLLDVGTGYFLEKSPTDGVDYCKRKVVLVRENMEKLIEVIETKRKQAMQVNRVFAAKMQAAEAAATSKTKSAPRHPDRDFGE